LRFEKVLTHFKNFLLYYADQWGCKPKSASHIRNKVIQRKKQEPDCLLLLSSKTTDSVTTGIFDCHLRNSVVLI
jgi:hypothetical protein